MGKTDSTNNNQVKKDKKQSDGVKTYLICYNLAQTLG